MENTALEHEPPVIEKRGKNGKFYLTWQGKEFGPWDELEPEARFSPDRKSWIVRGTLHDRHYVLIDGIRYGPFAYHIREPWYDPKRGAFAFAASRDREFLLIAGNRIVKRGRLIEKGDEEVCLSVNGKGYGPYQHVCFPRFSPSGRKWAAEAERDGGSWLLLNGREYGPFARAGCVEFSMGAETCACRCDRGRGVELLLDGERSFGPYREITGPMFSPDGRRWAMDVEKAGKWHGFVVDGVEYGPFPRQFFFPRFSPDSRHWFVVLDGGREDRPHSFILDGELRGPFRIRDIGFMEDGRFVCAWHKGAKFWLRAGDREIGPFRHEKGDMARIGEEPVAQMGYVVRMGKEPIRCVMSLRLAERNKIIFFSANNGETLEDAIEIINADGTEEGVAAEHRYMRILLGSRNLTGEFVEQRLIPREGKHFDQLIYKVGKRRKISLFFDITSFFGK